MNAPVRGEKTDTTDLTIEAKSTMNISPTTNPRVHHMSTPLGLYVCHRVARVPGQRVRIAKKTRALHQDKDGYHKNISTSHAEKCEQFDIENEMKAKERNTMPERYASFDCLHTTLALQETYSVKKALVAAAAAVLLSSTISPEDSWAARSGGRAGGRAFRSAPRVLPLNTCSLQRLH